MEILIYGNPILRQKAAWIEKLTDNERRLVQEMAELMYRRHGIGLAANQVGVLKQIAVIDIDHLEIEPGGKPRRFLRTLINPQIIWQSEEDSPYREGCLSLPGIETEIYRPQKIKVAYYDLDYQPQELEAEGMLARVIQHEVDHLQGILFIDHLSFSRRAMLAGQLNRLKKEARGL